MIRVLFSTVFFVAGAILSLAALVFAIISIWGGLPALVVSGVLALLGGGLLFWSWALHNDRW